MKLYLFLPLSLVLTYLTHQSVKPGTSIAPDRPAGFLPDEAQQLALGKAAATNSNAFAADLLHHYLHSPQQKGENIFFSPFSISTAIGMTAEGAKGPTLKEIRKAFHLEANDSTRQWGFYSLIAALNNSHSNYALNTTNALWIQKDEELEADFLNSTRKHYFAGAETLDFKNDPENSRKTINRFVENKTANLIKDLIPEGVIQPHTKLILTNTIYFKADWLSSFNPDYTQDLPFTNSSGFAKKVRMMMQKGHFNYFEDKQFQGLELPYKNGEVSMLLLLPRNELDFSTIDRKDIETALAAPMQGQQVHVQLPKFKFETSYKMKEDLIELGMPLAFSDIADFSGISRRTPLKISEVIHKAVVEVDELGTEAAAATAVIMEETTSVGPRRPEPKYFNANHPFLFVIRHNQTGALLFVGVVNAI